MGFELKRPGAVGASADNIINKYEKTYASMGIEQDRLQVYIDVSDIGGRFGLQNRTVYRLSGV